MDVLTKNFVEKVQMSNDEDEIYELAKLYAYLRRTRNIIDDLYDELWNIFDYEDNLDYDEDEVVYNGKFFLFNISVKVLDDNTEVKDKEFKIDDRAVFEKIQESNIEDAVELLKEYKYAKGEITEMLKRAINDAWNFEIVECGKYYVVVDAKLGKILFEINVTPKGL